ncbi:MAG TPA: hypothetical protein VKQ32_06365 [Polyangia bacterium]|nr:hypothetical protein [Polyangia bacterium]
MRWRVALVAVAAWLVAAGCRKSQRQLAEPVAAQPASAPTSTRATPPSEADIATFWAWFQKNAAALRADQNLRRTMGTISDELEKLDAGVIAEIGELRESRELVISADGKRALFPAVQQIYSARPQVPGWTIVAFRQRAKPMVIEMNGKRLDPKSMKVVAARDGDKLDIEVFVPGFTTLEDLGAASFVVLDHLLGEYDMETKIGGIEWAAIEKAPASAHPLAELPALLDKTFPPKR